MKPEPWTRDQLSVFVMYWHKYVIYYEREPSFDDYHSFCSRVNIMAEVDEKLFKRYTALKVGHWPNGKSATVDLKMFDMAKEIKRIEDELKPIEKLREIGRLDL